MPSERQLSCSRWPFLQDSEAKTTDTQCKIHLNTRLPSFLSANGAGRHQQFQPAPLIKIQREEPMCSYNPPLTCCQCQAQAKPEPSIFIAPGWKAEAVQRDLGSHPPGHRLGWGSSTYHTHSWLLPLPLSPPLPYLPTHMQTSDLRAGKFLYWNCDSCPQIQFATGDQTT